MKLQKSLNVTKDIHVIWLFSICTTAIISIGCGQKFESIHEVASTEMNKPESLNSSNDLQDLAPQYEIPKVQIDSQIATCKMIMASGVSAMSFYFPGDRESCLEFFYAMSVNNSIFNSRLTMRLNGLETSISPNEVLARNSFKKYISDCTKSENGMGTGNQNFKSTVLNLNANSISESEKLCRTICQNVDVAQFAVDRLQPNFSKAAKCTLRTATVVTLRFISASGAENTTDDVEREISY